MTEIQFQFTFADYVHAQKLHVKRSLWRRFSSSVARYLIPVLGAIGILFEVWTLRDGFNGGTIMMLGFSLLWLSYPLLVRWNWKVCYKRTRSDDGDWTLVFTEDQIRSSTSNAHTEFQWGGVRTTMEDEHIFLLYIAPAKFFPIPKRACTPAQIEELRQLFAAHIGAKV